MTAQVPLARQAEDFVVGTLYYNGINFPPARKMKATYEPVYDDAGRIAKYLKGKVDVECILFPGCLEDPEVLSGSGGQYALPYRRAQSVSAVTDGTSKDATTDTTLEEVRKRLSEPCQWLVIDKQGAGHINLNDPLGHSPKDVNNGPKPQTTRWTPYTNKMAKVEWSIEFCFSPCDNQATGAHSHGHGFCQFPFEVSLDINDRGLGVRTVTGRVELARTRIPTINSNAGASESFSMLKLEQQILSVFPRGKQFKRTDQKFSMSADRKYVKFSIVDTEINSVDSYGEGILNEDVRVTTSSTFDGDGACFTRWMTTMEGSINLIPGYTKVWAWQEITRLLQRYLFSVADRGKPPGPVTGTSFDDYYHLQNLKGVNTRKSWAILRNIKYTDNIFDRSVQFSYTWELFINPDDIFKATGLFLPIEDLHNDRDARWNKWLVSTKDIYDSGGWQQVEFNQNMDIVVSLCDAWYGPQATGIPTLAGQPTKEDKKVPGQNKVKNHTKSVLPPPPDKTSGGRANGFYSGYDCKFAIDSVQGSLVHTPLHALPVVQEAAQNFNRMTRDSGRLQINNTYQSSSAENLPKSIVHRVRPNTHIITMTGYATRLGILPQVPNVESFGGLPVYKIGTDKIRPALLGGGIDLINGSTYSVHGLAWQKQYVVYGTPSEYVVKTDGHKAGILPG